MNRRWIRSGSYLDPRIWSGLPNDVLFMILACLPIRSLLKLRCVSRAWNKLLTSTVFINLQIKVTPQLPWILLFKCHNYRTLKAFDRSSNRWHNVSLSFLPTYATDLAASSAGLLCFRTLYSGQFVVCNPVSRSWKRLPPMSCSDSRGIITLLTTTSTNNRFQVIVAAAEGDDFKQVTEIYSSVTNSWKIISTMPCVSLRPETAFCNGKLYFTTCSEPPLIFSLDMERETWRRFEAPLPDSLTYCLPVVSDGQLHLVGGLGRYGIAKRMSIWRLVDEVSETNRCWREVHRMPDAECTKFAMNCYHNYEQISCTSQRDLICLSCSTWPQALVFCVPSCSWIWLPHCEQIPLRTSRGFKWFSLEPNLQQISVRLFCLYVVRLFFKVFNFIESAVFLLESHQPVPYHLPGLSGGSSCVEKDAESNDHE